MGAYSDASPGASAQEPSSSWAARLRTGRAARADRRRRFSHSAVPAEAVTDGSMSHFASTAVDRARDYTAMGAAWAMGAASGPDWLSGSEVAAPAPRRGGPAKAAAVGSTGRLGSSWAMGASSGFAHSVAAPAKAAAALSAVLARASAQDARREQDAPSVASDKKHHASTYDETAARRALALAQASYCVAPGDTAWACPTCVDRVDVHAIFDGGGGRAVVGYDEQEKTLFVAFRGSENVPNWINNLKFVKIHPWESLPDVGVDSGFFDWYLALRPGLLGNLTSAAARFKSSRVRLTGHSAGSAPAVFLVRRLFGNNVSLAVADVTTFGSPRLGDGHFVRRADAGLSETRVTHYRDCVPHLPLDDMFWLGYAHLPTEVYYDEASTVATVCDGSGEMRPARTTAPCTPVAPLRLNVSSATSPVVVCVSGRVLQGRHTGPRGA
ncbi:phospholipase [Aureococcus anophagefferens]|nr:phospholipase [Aureococcus anophagefferens]